MHTTPRQLIDQWRPQVRALFEKQLHDAMVDAPELEPVVENFAQATSRLWTLLHEGLPTHFTRPHLCWRLDDIIALSLGFRLAEAESLSTSLTGAQLWWNVSRLPAWRRVVEKQVD